MARQINVSNSATPEITRKLAYNNVFDNNQKGGVCLPFENPRSSGNLSDWNVFTRPPSFRLNKYQDTFQWQTVLDKLQQAGFTIGPESTDAQGEGAFRQFGLDAWRVATGWDLHSVVVEKADIDVQPYRMLMRVSWPETWRDLRMPAVDEMTLDFGGTPMATDAVVDGLDGTTARPGPLQGIGPDTTWTCPLRSQSAAARAPVRHWHPCTWSTVTSTIPNWCGNLN